MASKIVYNYKYFFYVGENVSPFGIFYILQEFNMQVRHLENIICQSLTQPETPQTCCKLWTLPACCKLWTLPACCKLSSSCSKPVDFIKLQQVCEDQTCCNLIFADLLQVVTTTCSKLAGIKLQQVCRSNLQQVC